MPSAHPHWQPLALAKGAPDRFGAKAARLARAAVSLPVLEGWVLEVSVAASLDAANAARLARSLIAAHPTPRWILRSSSPLEDTEVTSAAGLFTSLHAEAVPESLARSLLDVVASARDPRVRTLLDPANTTGALPIAVLAQPHVHFRRWCTVEWREQRAWVEGWSLGPDDAPRWTHWQLEERPNEWPNEWRIIADLARRARAAEPDQPLLLELGEDGHGRAWLLQTRRAPATAPAEISHFPHAPELAVPSIAGLGARVHAADAAVQWIWDREHCPTPLCPLLAGLFGAWILEHPTHPSRLIQGRWHDRAGPSDDSAPRLALDDLEAVDSRLQDWSERERTQLLPALDALCRRVSVPWEPQDVAGQWRAFVRAWMDWQALYYGGPSGALRRWVRDVLAASSREGPIRLALGRTVAAERAERWTRLAARLRTHRRAPLATAQAVQRWVEDHEGDPLARDLLGELEDCGHLCAWAFDGRGIPWEFAPTPFWRALALRMHVPAQKPIPAEPIDPDPTARRVNTILRRAEDDDDLLLQSYHQWQRAVRRALDAPGTLARFSAADLLDLLPNDLLEWMDSADAERVHSAHARGRALARAWNAWEPQAAVNARGEAVDPHRLTGIGAAPGRAEGTAHRAAHLELLDLPAGDGEAVIAVVSTITPADAVYFAGLAALICEAGDLLGHASVLAREYGVPCVVGVADARRRLGQAERLLVDGDRGEVVVRSPRS